MIDYNPLLEEPTETSIIVLSCGCLTTLDDYCGKLPNRDEKSDSYEWVYRRREDVPLFLRTTDEAKSGCIPLCYRIGLEGATDMTLAEFDKHSVASKAQE